VLTRPDDTEETRPMPDDKRPSLPGDPAFPAVVPDEMPSGATYYEGMTVRDYLAGQAPASRARQFPDQLGSDFTVALSGAQRCARACREHADALIAELAQGGG
jgi:hypothetical protein